MKNSGNRTGMDGSGSGIEPRYSEARETRIIGSSASCMNVRSRPNGLKSASAARRLKMVSMLLVCAAAIFVISSVATVPMSRAEGPQAPSPTAEPFPPYYAAGYTYDAFGTILPGCEVNITDVNTNAYNLTTSDAVTGFYMVDIKNGLVDTGGFNVGDTVNVTATKGLAIGWNEAVSQDLGYVAMDITLNGVIPEFPMAVLPVVGMLALFIVVSLKRKGTKK